MYEFDRLHIGGEWVAPGNGASLALVNPATEEPAGRVPRGTAEDADRAVRAARAAFEGWASLPIEERRRHLANLAGALRERTEDFARAIVTEMGAPIKLATRVQVGLPLTTLQTLLEATEVRFEEEIGTSLVVREPIGVVACITPWNYPLHQTIAKLGPALLAGCTVVHKPSEIAPVDAFLLADLCASIGFPPGVYNVVSGTGPEVGEALAAHPLVDMVSFTGSTRAGRRVGELAAGTIKKVALELGGKSAAVVLDDADVATAVPAVVKNCYLNSGQTCTALTRLLAPRARLDEVAEAAVATAEGMRVGDPMDTATTLGPLVSAAQRERVRGYIARGVEEGARLLTGGAEAPDGLERGFYVRPTVFSAVETGMTIAREEIFGPVLSILPYDSEEEAVAIANDSDYGLSGAVWSGDRERALRVARRMRTGQVEVNGGRFNPAAPFGGYRQSGLGRELGRYGVEEFLEVKALQL